MRNPSSENRARRTHLGWVMAWVEKRISPLRCAHDETVSSFGRNDGLVNHE